jgi:glycosyltransferase involved in cell wall biosynthesis
LARTTFSGYHPKKELNIGYGIEAPPPNSEALKISFKKQYNLENEEPYLLFLSRIHPKKGLDLLLKAYFELLNNSNFSNLLPNLVIAGSGIETEYGTKILNYLEENPTVNAKVQLVGLLSGDAKWGAIYGCDAFILPSHQENFGIAVVEAMACKKAVLISNKVNIWREIAEGDGGIVNEDDLAGTIASLEQWVGLTQEQQIQIGVNAHTIYLNKFTAEATSKKFVEVLTKNFVE